MKGELSHNYGVMLEQKDKHHHCLSPLAADGNSIRVIDHSAQSASYTQG